ncbi:PREDICTED: uncharacterized protein LOC104779247 [Camelina sativa]|uniref:Uncharacterized protein LOC104779247 n=1 Tax=Camelina sativa TaxID=90675 RepID=A0ABM0YJG2_CAMSA|nr:PREDICTED: uncharacterized protein LOC104779247 [Camelina sativa]
MGLFGSKGELVTANKVEVAAAHKGYYRHEDKNPLVCDHCKKPGHFKSRCWILHPHLRANRPMNNCGGPRAHQVTVEPSTAEPNQRASDVNGTALAATSDLVRKSDLDALIKALKDASGNSYLALNQTKPLIVDSGASHHMISDSKLISELKPAVGNVIIANGEKVPVKGIGDLKLFDKTTKAFYMPSFTSKLLSVKRATTDLNCYAIFGPNNVHFQDIETSQVLGQGVSKDDLYVLEDLNLSSSNASCFSSVFIKANNAMWHARLGHPHSRALEIMFPNRVFEAFLSFQNYVTNHYNAKIKILRSDNGGEYTSHAIKQHLINHDIIHKTSCPYTPQQNGVAERKNRHPMEVARSMMFHTNVPRRFWGDAVLAICYLINRIPTKILQDVSPFEVNYETNLRLKALKQCSLGYFSKKNWEDLGDLSTSSSDRAINLRIILEQLGATNDRDAHHSPGPNSPEGPQPPLESISSESTEPGPQTDQANQSNDEETDS